MYRILIAIIKNLLKIIDSLLVENSRDFKKIVITYIK